MPQTENANNQIVEREKPLNQTQLKNLRELVSGDFRDLQQEVNEEIDRRLRTRLAEIDEEFKGSADLEKARKQLKNEASKAEERIRSKIEKILENETLALMDRYGNEAVVDDILSVGVNTKMLKQKGRDEAIEKAEGAARALKQTATRVINRQQRQVDRQCLLQGISATGAHELIRDLPEAEDILPLVTAEMQLKESDAMDELMNDIPAVEGGA